jgi:transglutaminase-like putative cysteine protease
VVRTLSTLLLLAIMPGAFGTAHASHAARPAPIPADTIYSLAVDSAKYAGEAFVYLLDDGVLRYETDGRGSRTYRQVIQILKESAVSRWAEYSFSFEPRHERLTVNWVRVVSRSGQLISDKPGVSQDADVPAPMNDPAYIERKVRRLSLPNVRPGTIVDYSYTVEELQPFRHGDFFSAWRVNPGILVRRSRLQLETPASLMPRIVARNLTFKPVTTESKGRRTITWAAQDVPKVEPEVFASDSNDVLMSITVGAPATWQDVGAWYAGLARDRYAMTPAVEQKLASVVIGSKTLGDSLRAVHKYVSQDVRYVAISLGIGGYQPRSAADVVATGYGDCKDKATLFITLVSRFGVIANPVLLAAGGRVERGLPTISQFNHAIAAIERPSGRLFVDLTAGDVPWGGLPEADQGQFVLVVHPDGRTEEVVTPEDDPKEIRNRMTVEAVLDTAGFAAAHAEMELSGSAAEAYHAMLNRSPLDSTARAQFERRLASGIYPEAEGDSLRFEDEAERSGEFRIGFVARNGRAAQLAGPVAILSLPFLRQIGDVKPVVAELKARTPRRFPIDAEQVSGGGNGATTFRLTLPVGWRAQLPKDVSLSGPFGELTITYAQEGRVLTISQRRIGGTGVLPPDRVNDVITWLEQVAAATREGASIVLMRPSQ